MTAIATDPFGVPFEFILFGAMLIGIALFHNRSLLISIAGLGCILAFETLVTGYPTGSGAFALVAHARHEWVIIANLLLLLTGFELLSGHFERSNVSDHLPGLLPDNWTGGVAVLAIVFVLSGFLDNIAAAVLGGVIARHVYKGRVAIGFVAAIVATSNAGGAGSVIGDTTTTIMWLHGISPLTVLPAYLGAAAAFMVIAPLAALEQERHQPIVAHDERGHALEWRRIWIVAIILACAVGANVVANSLSDGKESAPWLGLALWAAILLTSMIAPPDWASLRRGAKGAVFLSALVASASLMPLRALPQASPATAFGLGLLSSVFDNIPLTALALRQGGHDWALLAYAVGFGGSMVWFGSSAGVAIANMYPQSRSVVRWVKEGWFVPIAYGVGFGVMYVSLGWNPVLDH
jgi:Na+/H+ antiporter NhaD/arsenite permease-like protein